MKTLKPIALSLSLALLLGSVSAPALAAQSPNKDLNVKMGVYLQCRILLLPDVSFPAYTPTTTLSLQGGLTYRCTKNNKDTIVTLTLNCGQHGVAAGGVCVYKMKNKNPNFGEAYLDYKIYTNSAYATEWPRTGVAATYPAGADGIYNRGIFVRIPSGQNAAAYGEYEDIISATLTF